jgi:hypothetical protein
MLAEGYLAWLRETFYHITRKASSLVTQYTSPSYCPIHPPSRGNFAPQLNVNSLWVFDTATVPTRHNNYVVPGRKHIHIRSSTTPTVPNDNHHRPWTTPRPYMDPKLRRISNVKHQSQQIARFWNRTTITNDRDTTSRHDLHTGDRILLLFKQSSYDKL